MAFLEGCSCRVWALDGWVDDGRATLVNNRISDVGFALFANNFAATHSLDERVEQFKQCRISVGTNLPCTVFGDFEYPGDALPTHMWLEYGPWIYDTIPGRALVRKLATAQSRVSPGCVDGAYNANQVGRVDSYLSVAQVGVLDRAVWVNDEFMP